MDFGRNACSRSGRFAALRAQGFLNGLHLRPVILITPVIRIFGVLRKNKGVFAEKGARFRGKWGLDAPPPPALGPAPPFLLGGGGGFTENPRGGSFRGEGGGGPEVCTGNLGGGKGAPRPRLPRKRAPFSAKTPFSAFSPPAFAACSAYSGRRLSSDPYFWRKIKGAGIGATSLRGSEREICL